MGGRNYNLNLPAEVDLPAWVLARVRLAEVVARERCARGEHSRRTETDAETGDEVCRYCKTIVEM